MTREDAYFERILLLSGIWDGYEKWLDHYLETEDPLSPIVVELTECGLDIKEIEYRLNLYCSEKAFDKAAVIERLMDFMREKHSSGKLSKPETLSLMYQISRHIEPGFAANQMMLLSDYYVLAEEGVGDMKRFDKIFYSYLYDGVPINTDDFFDGNAI